MFYAAYVGLRKYFVSSLVSVPVNMNYICNRFLQQVPTNNRSLMWTDTILGKKSVLCNAKRKHCVCIELCEENVSCVKYACFFNNKFILK